MMDDAERALFAASVRAATSSHTGVPLDHALAELGWADALAADVRAAVCVLFSAQGEANATSSALDDLVAVTAGHPGRAVVLPPIGRWVPPAVRTAAGLTIRGIATAALANRPRALIVAGTGVAFDVGTATVRTRPIHGIDPALGLAELDSDVTDVTELGPVDWARLTAIAQLAIGHELVGASRRMLELAREHALTRVQFGQPIARFQAVRHRLAEALVSIEAADAVLDAAWLDGSPTTAAMAKAAAGRSARVTARHCQQVLAGIGFTTEHPLHRYVRRVLVLEQVMGSTGGLTRELGETIIERGRLPALLPL